jgi:hypothetical protein
MKSLANAKGQSTTAAGHKPGSLLAQWKLVEAAVRDRRLSRGDIAVLFRVVDNYYHLYGNSRAAHSYLATGTGLSRRAVISSTKRLRAFGYLEVARIGSGTRPTEYVPNWQMNGNFTATSGEPDSTSEVNCISPQESPAVNATSPKPAYVAGLQAGLRKQGPAPPPPLGGPDEPPAAPAQDSFDELWNVYGRKHERNKARAEYQKLDPDAMLHAKIVQAAAEWRAAYEAQGRPKKYWKCLHTWLAGECWLEDLPEAYENRKMTNTTKRRQREIDEDYRTWLQDRLRPGQRVLARFIDWMEIESGKDRTVFEFDFAALKGRSIIGRFIRHVVSPSEEFDQLCAACGDDLCVDDFPGSLVWVIRRSGGGVGYERYYQSDAAEPRVPPPPPAIGSSSPTAYAGGKGASEF